jgi:hypothetical protein
VGWHVGVFLGELMFGYPTILPFLNYPTTTAITTTQHSYLPYAVVVVVVVVVVVAVVVVVNCSDSIRDLVICWVVDVE